MSREDIPLDEEQQRAYQAAYECLQHPDLGSFQAPIPTLVSLDLAVPKENEMADFPVTIITPTKGHHALTRAVEELDGLEKEEQLLKERSPIPQQLTEIITNQTYRDSKQAIESLHEAGQVVPRRVCQHPFRKNDIVWVCRTCQADETCVLCHSCYSQSNHEGHDVAFYHAQAGGCCDCGDPDAWDPAGFCPHHGPNVQADPSEINAVLPAGLVHRVRGVVPAAIDWMVEVIAKNAESAYERVHGRPKKNAIATNNSPARMQEDRPLGTSNNNTSSTAEMMDIDVEDDSDSTSDSDDEPTHNLPAPPQVAVAASAVPSLDSNAMGRPYVFSPTAASSSAAKRMDAMARFQEARNQELGSIGSSGHGLYIVLHADDIRSSPQIFDAIREFLGTSSYYTDTLLQKVTRTLRANGQLVVWGNLETVTQVGPTQFHLWMDHDAVASSKMGAVMLERVGRLTKHKLFCGLVTRDELVLEQRAVALLQWLSEVARSCDPLCQTVAECILSNRHLVPLLRADFKMSARVTKAWYSLLLTLLAVPTFKSHLAAAYCDTYRYVTSKYARGMGVLERSGYTLSVQFLNRVTYVVDLVRGRDLLGKLGKSLLETMLVACRSKHLNGRLDPNHFVLTHRRYSPCISDLKCVLNVKGMPRLFAAKGGTFLWDWIDTLSISQQMDPQHWRTWKQGHVEDESRGWVGAFNASISLGSLFERLLGWDDDEKSPIEDPMSPLSKELMPCSELSYHILLDGIFAWQKKEMLFYDPTPTNTEPHKMAPASLPFSTVATSHGTSVAMLHLPVSQNTSFSFHLPLHRFVAACLRELCLRRDDGANGISSLLGRLRDGLSASDCDQLFLGLMEFPLLIVSRAAQVRAGLWKRNGAGLSDQVLNYSEPPFCRTMRDADLLLAQFAVLGRTRHQAPQTLPDPSDVGMSFFINLLLHRLGIFEFCGLRKAPDELISRYVEEAERNFFPVEPKVPTAEASSSDLVLPSSYSPANDQASFLVLLEEFLYCMVIFISELPQAAPSDRGDHTNQARDRLYREVVHRLASGPKTHSELLEVHHVMSHWDNLLLSEEGKLINPDDATGAALGKVLEEVADRKSSRGKLEPDKWEIKRDAWVVYDPSFHHISLRMHQTAAENRPKPKVDKESSWGRKAQPYAPEPPEPHPCFKRLRRDATSDSVTLAIAYRVLHMHMRQKTDRDMSNLSGRLAYDRDKSETALARAVHLLTLGIYSWSDATREDECWRIRGGGSPGSIFSEWSIDIAPVMADWVEKVLLADPADLTGTEWYRGEENLLLLLRRLAASGGESGVFTAQDVCVRAGSAWICECAARHSFAAKDLVRPKPKATDTSTNKMSMAERQRRSREKAMAMMRKAQTNFADMNADDLREKDEQTNDASSKSPASVSTPHRPIRATSFGSNYSTASSIQTSGSDLGGFPSTVMLESDDAEQTSVPPRLLKDRPQCIICSELEVDSGTPQRNDTEDGEGMRKRSKRRAENALGFVGYIQASTVLKGGGGCPPDLGSTFSPVREFVGSHVALCGHAVHSECCESYLATVSQREDRVIGKRDEFRCPLCQRLSNCLVPFIDVGSDWVEPPCLLADSGVDASDSEIESEKMQVDPPENKPCTLVLDKYLSSTPWWVVKHNRKVVWDGQSGFVQRASTLSPESTPENSPTKSVGKRRGRRPLTKKDLYAAWNAMMRTPRFVRRRLRSRNSQPGVAGLPDDPSSQQMNEPEESTGETVVWRRFMDQVSDLSYRADSKRLGDEHLHDLFGEFRHYVVEKYAYNMANRFAGGEPTEWPFCVFNEPLSDQRRQEMSREKILSKLLLTVQAFTYSCCCEIFEAKRTYRKLAETASAKSDKGCDTVLSKFGIAGVSCGGEMLVMPRPSSEKDCGLQPFDGRIGKLRYLGLALVAASGAVAADLVQLAISFPTERELAQAKTSEGEERNDRSPIAYPILLGNVLTHIIAAMCATCGRGRALSDSLDLTWSPLSSSQSFVSSDDLTSRNSVDSVIEDCEGFLKLGLLARVLQVLLGRLRSPPSGFRCPSAVVVMLQEFVRRSASAEASPENMWKTSCGQLLIAALSQQEEFDETIETFLPTFDQLNDACESALSAACSFLIDAGSIMQILVPSVVWRFGSPLEFPGTKRERISNYVLFEKLRSHMMLEHVGEMMSSTLTTQIVSNWYKSATNQGKLAGNQIISSSNAKATLRGRLYRTQGFREFDWPSPGESEKSDHVQSPKDKSAAKQKLNQPEDGPNSMQIENLAAGGATLSTSDVVSQRKAPPLIAYSSKKIIPLLGGHFDVSSRRSARPRVAGMPVAYTDLYAELGTLMPECEQTAVCLICGEVLNAGGKGECTKHSYKCGAGAGIFFLLQECSGLILHRSKAAYIHSPYVDSHGETPQHRGRPLNLDLDRYEHIREVWYGHSVRQHVIAERGSSRQVILPDFY